jgi:KUP system potassium uptake protein
MEKPDIPAALRLALVQGCRIPFADVVYYVGHATVLSRDDGKGLPRWEEALFAAMDRNAVHLTDFLRLPRDAVVEIGREIAI